MNKDLLISTNILIPLSIFNIIFAVFTISYDIDSFGFSAGMGRLITYITLLSSFVVTLVLIADVFHNKVESLPVWIFLFIVFGGISALIYLIRRSKFISKN